MSTAPKTPGPADGPDSYDAIDGALRDGFVVPGQHLCSGVGKTLAAVLRARIAAVELAIEEGPDVPLQGILERIGMSERWLHNHFVAKTALYAFPPPELGQSLGGAGADARTWPQVGDLVRPVFDALDTNLQGRRLLAGLVELHRSNPQLRACDGYFAVALEEAGLGRAEPPTIPMLGLLTDGIRKALEGWVEAGQPCLKFVADRFDELLSVASEDRQRLFFSSRSMWSYIDSAVTALVAKEPRKVHNLPNLRESVSEVRTKEMTKNNVCEHPQFLTSRKARTIWGGRFNRARYDRNRSLRAEGRSAGAAASC